MEGAAPHELDDALKKIEGARCCEETDMDKIMTSFGRQGMSDREYCAAAFGRGDSRSRHAMGRLSGDAGAGAARARNPTSSAAACVAAIVELRTRQPASVV